MPSSISQVTSTMISAHTTVHGLDVFVEQMGHQQGQQNYTISIVGPLNTLRSIVCDRDEFDAICELVDKIRPRLGGLDA